jgi:hypothetical protein
MNVSMRICVVVIARAVVLGSWVGAAACSGGGADVPTTGEESPDAVVDVAAPASSDSSAAAPRGQPMGPGRAKPRPMACAHGPQAYCPTVGD